MNILVLGGTGFIGPHVVQRLVAEGHNVTVFHRGKIQAVLPASVGFISGNYKSIPDFREDFRRLAPYVVLDMIPITEQDARNVINTLHGIARRVVAASSQDVYLAWGVVSRTDPGPADPNITEDSPVRESRYPYRGRKMPASIEWDFENYDKVLVERAFLSDQELPATIMRLPMVYGPGDPSRRTQVYLKQMNPGQQEIHMEESAARWRGPLGYVEDVASAIALAVMNNRAAGRIYNVAEPEVRSVAEFVREIGEAAGWKGRLVEVPDGSLPSEFSAFNMKQHCLTDSTRIRRELGFRETVPRHEALRRTVAWEQAIR